MSSDSQKKPVRRGIFQNSLFKTAEPFDTHHLLENGPLVLQRDPSGMAQMQATQQRQATRYLKKQAPVVLGWVAPKPQKPSH